MFQMLELQPMTDRLLSNKFAEETTFLSDTMQYFSA